MRDYGYSKHQTGLALDLYLVVDGEDVTENEDMMEHPEIWEKIHAKLGTRGFILRYLDGCELHALRYAGDECNTPENVEWLNGLDEGAGYTQVVEFIGGFHSPVAADEPSAWDLDAEYADYQWWLARTGDGGWQLVSSGY